MKQDFNLSDQVVQQLQLFQHLLKSLL